MDDNLSKSRFLNSIDKYAKKKCLKLAEEIRQIENDRLLKEEVKIVEQARSLMMSELTEVKNKISVRIYKERTNALKKICQKRLDIENEIFDLCKMKLEKFTQSNKYFAKLKNSIENASKTLGKSFSMSIRKEDFKHTKKLKELFSSISVSILENNNIRNGGVIFKKGNIILDDSFDCCLKKQREFFTKEIACKLM